MAPEPEAGGGVPDPAEAWGAGGLVGEGRYRLTHRLGRGGMAEVFAAEDVRLGRTVAVKLLRADLAEDPVSKARFTREAQSVAGLNHHAIVAVYDSGEDVVNGQPVPYIVMELVEGRTIRDLLINADAPPPEQALIIVSGVLEALAYSHQHGIVHRDIKPANVIITHAGAVKVMDFGIARALHGASTTMTQTGMVMGTPQYLSPEQALGKAVDHRSDLYATGCLLYELLALRPPFTGETPLSVVYQHVQDMPVPPSQVSDVVPPELDGLVMRSLAKDPDDRFQSAEEMRGLVQYALQMLQQQGSHTNSWNTGYVPTQETLPTTALGGPGPMGATAVHPVHGETAQGPILPPMNPDDGGYEGGHGGGRRRGRRGKMLLAALALVAVVAGTAYAIKAGDTDTGDRKPPVKTSQSPSQDTPKEPEPSQTESASADLPKPPQQGSQTPWRPKKSYTPQQPLPSFTESTDPSPTNQPTESEGPAEPQEPTTSAGPPDGEDPGGSVGEPSGDPGGTPGGPGEATGATEGEAGTP
ncbi:protein kinase domain-containing protein [Streptomyces yaizuensis]|uniref:non-specific serine/threonine protein kinase n=1 Tax=Streptomyces yaizuensis TaxID=2989713 RepID=A0ABQ5P351_9ACTN|nr:protein kinase [Streptomyces sp. YSPA8]GLF96651.1 protein kinase [Streptomyces sp. YSPA8]